MQTERRPQCPTLKNVKTRFCSRAPELLFMLQGHVSRSLAFFGIWYVHMWPYPLIMTTIYLLLNDVGVQTLLEDVQELKPTIFISVPRLYNRIYDKVHYCTQDSAVTGNSGGVWRTEEQLVKCPGITPSQYAVLQPSKPR